MKSVYVKGTRTKKAEYVRKARRADVEYNDWDPATQGMGPCEERLGEFGVTRALVAGPRGEVSTDFTRLVKNAADVGAERKWRRMGARSQSEARAVLLNRYRRMAGITIVKAAARLMRESLETVLCGGGAAAAARRRKWSRRFERTDREEYWNHHGVGPRGRA